MPNNADTGNTGTLTFGTSGLTVNYKQVGEHEETREKLECSHLGTTGYKEYVPSDLVEPGEFEVEFYFDGALNSLPAITGAAETITKSFPLAASQSVRATVVGTGFFIGRVFPAMANGTLMMAKGKVAFDGFTGPTYTVGS